MNQPALGQDAVQADALLDVAAIVAAVDRCDVLAADVKDALCRCLHAPRSLADTRLRALTEVILAELQTPFIASRVAQLAGLERQYFSTFFRLQFGVNFSRWRRGVRVACAIYLLLVPRLSVAATATRVGYRTASELGRAMRKETGLSPRSLARSTAIRSPAAILHAGENRAPVRRPCD